MDKLLPPRQAAEVLGIHADDLGELRRTGRITGLIQIVRGTKGRPRYWYAESEISRYIASLQPSTARREVVVKKQARSPRRTTLKGLREFV